MNDPQIISLLSVIPFVEIQTFMEQQIRKLIMNSIRETYFNTLSMNATLPNDLIGHILSFHPYHAPNINQTSKMWNKCALQNKFIQNKERIKEVEKYDFNYSEEESNTWIVDANRTQLTNDEINASCKGPISDIDTAVGLCESGDKLLIYDGVYECKSRIEKSIQLIGAGKNVVVTNRTSEDTRYIAPLAFENNTISYIENITFAIDPDSDHEIIDIGSGAKVIFNKCVFKHGETGIWCPEGVCLDTKRCTFTKCDCAIYVVPGPVESNVNVVGCLFDSCSHTVFACSQNNNPSKVKLMGIGNIFRNNLSYPFEEECPFEHDCTRYSLRCNILEGERGRVIDQKVVDANAMYLL
eukprot:792554_1